MLKSLFSFLLILLISAFTTAQSQTAESYYDNGKTLESDGKYEEAVTAFKKAISLNANYTDALYELGWCYNELAQYSDAVTPLKKANQLSPKASVYLELGYAQQYSGNTEDAIASYKKAVQLNNEYALAYKYLGNVYLNSKYEYTTARDYYKKYLLYESSPDEVTLYNIGYCENQLEHYDEAISFLKQAIDKKVDDYYAYNELGWAYYQKDMAEDAIDAYMQAQRYNSQSATAYSGLGNVYRVLKSNAGSALPNYLKAIELSSESATANYGAGWCYNDKGDYEKAVPYLKRAIEISSQYNSAMTELGYSYYQLKQYSDALDVLRKAKSIQQTNLCLYYMGLCYVELGQKYNAQQVYDEMKKRSFNDADNLQKKISNM